MDIIEWKNKIISIANVEGLVMPKMNYTQLFNEGINAVEVVAKAQEKIEGAIKFGQRSIRGKAQLQVLLHRLKTDKTAIPEFLFEIISTTKFDKSLLKKIKNFDVRFNKISEQIVIEGKLKAKKYKFIINLYQLVLDEVQVV